ncbi:MAG: hypothetical protein NWF06_10320 [Candidatus Bathyarchaeota archaeon]|nr:hypothetical protein [Candidatus Bathyarchaeum sp.]
MKKFVCLVFVVLLLACNLCLVQGSSLNDAKSESVDVKSFGNVGVPDVGSVPQVSSISVSETNDFVAGDCGDEIVWLHGVEQLGYSQILLNGSVLVHSLKWSLEFLSPKDGWVSKGVAQKVVWTKVSDSEVVVTRLFSDSLGTDFNVSFIHRVGEPTKIIVEGTPKEVGQYNAVLNVSGVTTKYYEANDESHLLKFWSENKKAVVFDYSDVYDSFGDVSSINFAAKASDHNFVQRFSLGEVKGKFELDPTFGYETQGDFSTFLSIEDNLAGSLFTLSETAYLYNLSAYIWNDHANVDG